MKGKRYTTEDKIRILREVDGGKSVGEVCREKNIAGQGVSESHTICPVRPLHHDFIGEVERGHMRISPTSLLKVTKVLKVKARE
jgi:hypothetical protein